LYDIRPGNGVGLFLQPCSPHSDYTRQGTTHVHRTLTLMSVTVLPTLFTAVHR